MPGGARGRGVLVARAPSVGAVRRRRRAADGRAGRGANHLGSRAAMPVNGANFDPRLAALYRDGRELLGDDVEWFDAHTHIGHNDPDGRKATPEEIIGGLDQAGPPPPPVFSLPQTGGA